MTTPIERVNLEVLTTEEKTSFYYEIGALSIIRDLPGLPPLSRLFETYSHNLQEALKMYCEYRFHH